MLILLRCPLCRNNLLGENNSKVFFCTNCHLGYDMDDGHPKRYSIFYVEPLIKKTDPQVLFPFWRILSEFRISSADENQSPSGKNYFYIPAFFIKNIHSFRDIGYGLSFKNLTLNTTEKRSTEIFPADRGLNDCLAYPLIYLYQSETRNRKGKKPVNITIDHIDISVAMITFYKINGLYQDSILSWEYPSGAFI